MLVKPPVIPITDEVMLREFVVKWYQNEFSDDLLETYGDIGGMGCR